MSALALVRVLDGEVGLWETEFFQSTFWFPVAPWMGWQPAKTLRADVDHGELQRARFPGCWLFCRQCVGGRAA